MTEGPDHIRFLRRGRDNLGQIRTDLGMLQGTRALVAELVQNSDDAEGATRMSFEVSDEALTIWNDGEFTRCDDLTSHECAWKQSERGHACDFHSFQRVAGGEKATREDATGAFGIGFTAVYQITDLPVLRSSGEEWTIDETRPEHERIRARSIECEGTTFVLPWALDDSHMRQQLRRAPVDESVIGALEADLLSVVPRAMLFLHRLNRIDVTTRGQGQVTFRRESVDGLVHITGTGGHHERWFTLDGRMGPSAALLREQHPNQITPGRPLLITLAVRVDDPTANGEFFATLPTEQSTGLPVSLHGSFFPLPDRKRIRQDETPEGRWNASIIRTAAALAARSLEAIVERAGDAWTINMLERSRALAQTDDSLGSTWWNELVAALPDAAIVPAMGGRRGTVRTVRLWNGEIEQAAASTLARLGIELVAPDFRAGWFGLRDSDVGIRRLNLADIAERLGAADADSAGPWVLQLVEDELSALYRLIDDVLSPNDQRNSKESRAAIARPRLVPTVAGELRTIAEAVMAPKGTVDLLLDAGVQAPVATLAFVARYPSIAGQVQSVTPELMLDWFESAFESGCVPDTFDSALVLDWLVAREESLDLDPQRVRVLPIFPTGQGRQPLGHLALPGTGFKDPLGLANVLDLDRRPRVEELRRFLGHLGADSLTLEHYCRTIVPKAVEAGLSGDRLERLLDFLVDNFPRIEENHEVRTALRHLDLVECGDGVQRRGEEVYFDDVDPRLVGEQRHTTSGRASAGRRRLLVWLGVAEVPRHHDVVERCLELRRSTADRGAVAGAILRHLDQFDRETFDKHYSRLRDDRWLPVEGDEQAARPKEVFSSFRRNLFASQGKFLDVPLGVQRAVSDTLDRLGVSANPTPGQVVAHLLWSAGNGLQVKDNLWNFLRDETEPADLTGLQGRACIPLRVDDDQLRFVRPDHCFWDENPFGTRFRYRLDDSFLQWRKVFDTIGARERPDHDDAIDILGEIAYRHGGQAAALKEADAEVVKQCWVLLNDLLLTEAVQPEELDELRSTECVLDAAGWLRAPDDVLFRDSSSLAEHFDNEAAQRLIERPQNMAVAFEAVGVRHLREVIRTEVVQRIDRSGPAQLAGRLEERQTLIARALATVGVSPMRITRFLDEVSIHPLEALSVQEFLELAGREHRTPSLDRHGLFQRHRNEFLVVESEEQPRWSEVARELASGLGLGGEQLADAAIRLLTVLSPATTASAAAELDALGFWRLDAADAGHVDGESVTISVDNTPDDESSPLPTSTGSGETVGVSGSPAGQSPVDGSGSGERDQGRDNETETAEDQPSDEGTSSSTARPALESGGPANAGREEGSTRAESNQGTRQARSTGTAESTSVGSRPAGPTKSRDRMASYVAPRHETSPAPESDAATERRYEVDRAAVDRVLAFERSEGREPQEQSHDNEGFDVISTSEDGETRYIEVKGTSQQWDGLGVGITSRQFLEAQRRAEEFWLYVVEVDDPNGEPFRIQDPASQIGKFFFDSAWRYLTEAPSVERPPLPAVPSVEGDRDDALPLLDSADGRPTGARYPARPNHRSGDRAFAVQIAGDVLGFAYRGGLVIADPDAEIGDDDLVVGLLRSRTDPETGGPLFVRYWQPERDFGGSLIGLRLQSDGGVPPVTVESIDDVEPLGVVRWKLRPDEMSEQ